MPDAFSGAIAFIAADGRIAIMEQRLQDNVGEGSQGVIKLVCDYMKGGKRVRSAKERRAGIGGFASADFS